MTAIGRRQVRSVAIRCCRVLPWRATAGCLALVLWACTTLTAQAPHLVVTSPEDGTYMTGPVVLQARVLPAGTAVRLVTFFADGRRLCTMAAPPWQCHWDAGAGLREHVVRVTATLEDGQRLVAQSRTRGAGYAETVEVDAVQVTATVTDRRGQFVKGLTQGQFRVKEDDVLQRIAAFAGENTPLELVIAVDVSQSMTDAMPVLKTAVKRFLAALRPEDQVTLLAFNDNIFTLARRSTEPAARLRAVDRLAPWGGTALFDVMLTALNAVGRQAGRRALVVFTDGEDQHSASTLQRVERRMETSDATVYTIGLGRSVHDQDLADVLERMAQMSGGRSFIMDRVEHLDQAFSDIVEELSNQYLLSYISSNDKRDGTWRRIKVELTETGYHVRHRQGYRAPGGTP